MNEQTLPIYVATEEQVAGLKNVVKASVIRELLPIVDNFERALKHVPEDLGDSDYIKGVQGIVKQFEKTLDDIGVKKIKTVGEPFDPRFHEAISMEEGDGTQEIVSEELQSGYQLGDEDGSSRNGSRKQSPSTMTHGITTSEWTAPDYLPFGPVRNVPETSVALEQSPEADNE